MMVKFLKTRINHTRFERIFRKKIGEMNTENAVFVLIFLILQRFGLFIIMVLGTHSMFSVCDCKLSSQLAGM